VYNCAIELAYNFPSFIGQSKNAWFIVTSSLSNYFWPLQYYLQIGPKFTSYMTPTGLSHVILAKQNFPLIFGYNVTLTKHKFALVILGCFLFFSLLRLMHRWHSFISIGQRVNTANQFRVNFRVNFSSRTIGTSSVSHNKKQPP